MKKSEILKVRKHRPFPLPDSPWVMQQTWVELLFLHYRVPYETLRALLPDEIEIDTYNGETWIGITPFKMRNVRMRCLPPIPTATNFLELNLRTYVRLNGRPGIYFFSLDASSALSVLGARVGALLPYFRADMSVEEQNGEFHYRSKRRGGRKTPAELDIRYKAVSEPFEASEGSLEAWLVERYCLYQKTTAGKFIEIDIHHLKWKLQQAEAEVYKNTLTEPFNINLPEQPPLTHFSQYQKVLVWPMRIVSQ